jgi:signal transduction histidine kinase
MNTLMGYSNEELVYEPFAKLFEYKEEAENFIRHIGAEHIKDDTEIVLLTKSGERKTFLASCSRINTPEGLGQYQGILYDYTNIKKSVAEQLLREKIETTERLVRSLAHEIRNPLTNINLSLHQLESEIEDDKKMFTDIVKRNSARINDLIGELMNLSNPVDKIEERIEVKELVHSTLAIAMDRIKLKQIEVTEKHTPEPVYVLGDLKKLQTALLNILINAVEAMEEGAGKLMVETSTSNDGWVCIQIKDNGVGISQQDMTHLFQPYFTGKKNGMGLGLATTHSFIQAHGGNLEVNSQPGKGSVFTVKLRTVSAAAMA